jgi:hypothetical protein
MGCSSGQGFYFSKPVDAERAQRLIRDNDTPQRGILEAASTIERVRLPEPDGLEPVPAGMKTVAAAPEMVQR